MVLALVVGAGTGLGAVAFRWLITRATWVFSGHADYSAVGIGQHPAHPWLPWLGPFFVVLAPVVGGLIYGPVVQRWAQEARGHGVPEVMLAISQRGGKIAGKVAVIKSLASAITIGSGGSVGREGPIVQIGSALGSKLAQMAHLSETKVRTLVACGAASGIAATFNAPIAGVFFALELLLRDFTAESFGMVVLAAVVASAIGRAILGDVPFLPLPTFEVHHAGAYLLFALLGVLAGVVGVVFTRTLYGIEDIADRLWRGPEWARPAVGGLLLGLLLLAVPQMYGVGYPVLEAGVQGKYVVGVMLGLMVAKVLATSLSIAIGGSGGVFAPNLFVGGMLGAAFGVAAHDVMPGIAAPAGAFALVGMGAVFAGAARAPITAVLIMFELTGEYTIILPLMLAIVLATGVSRALSRDSIYTLKLRRRGIEIDARAADPRLTDKTVGDIMEPPPPALGRHRAARGRGAPAAEQRTRVAPGGLRRAADRSAARRPRGGAAREGRGGPSPNRGRRDRRRADRTDHHGAPPRAGSAAPARVPRRRPRGGGRRKVGWWAGSRTARCCARSPPRCRWPRPHPRVRRWPGSRPAARRRSTAGRPGGPAEQVRDLRLTGRVADRRSRRRPAPRSSVWIDDLGHELTFSAHGHGQAPVAAPCHAGLRPPGSRPSDAAGRSAGPSAGGSRTASPSHRPGTGWRSSGATR